MTLTADSKNNITPTVHRIEVHPQDGHADPAGQAILGEAKNALGQVENVASSRVYLIQSALPNNDIHRIANELLTDSITQKAVIGAESIKPSSATLDIHYLPGVMDPAAQSVHDAICQMFETDALEKQNKIADLQVSTGFRYDFTFAKNSSTCSEDTLEQFAKDHLANTVVQSIHLKPYQPQSFTKTNPYKLNLTTIPIRDLDETGLAKLSRQGHLFLDDQEMRAVQDYYKKIEREPTDIELETIAQTWSEHCVHKTLKAKINYSEPDDSGRTGTNSRTDANGGTGVPPVNSNSNNEKLDFSNRPGVTFEGDGSITIDNLLKQTIAGATFKLMESAPHKDWCISVFDDNAGIVKLDDEHGIAIKVETHNHPSALEPYGGAATGIGGCIRDIIGTGLAAKPIANTDNFCVAPPEYSRAGKNGGAGVSPAMENNKAASFGAPLPKGVIHPKRILQRVVDGVRDYGNRMGIPTVNGSVWFHEDFLGNPLVFAGCIGIIPLDKCFGEVKAGDRIIALGGATGRDGIHGATFSSAELTDTHSDEFSHAVQIGNPITEKKVLDVILQARDYKTGTLFSAITDCGAGGFSSAIGEMGEKVGAFVTLDTAPLKYQGLSYTEIWISEAQERMVLSVPEENIATLKELCEKEDVLFCDLGNFGNYEDDAQKNPLLTLNYENTKVGELPMKLLHDGLPEPVRKATWQSAGCGGHGDGAGGTGVPPVNDKDKQMEIEMEMEDKMTGETPVPPAPSPPPPTPMPLSPVPVLPAPALPGVGESLYTLLAHPNIASKHWIIRQYDHEVQGGSTIKPLVGEYQDGPSDGAVIRPKLSSDSGIVIAGGMAPNLSEKMRQANIASDGDSYFAALAAIDEAVRNAVCVGANPKRIALLDNFCWPSCDDPKQLGTLVRAAFACYDGALAYNAPFVSGKDSLSNQFTTEDGKLITIPQTLLITALSTIENIQNCLTMDAKQAGNALFLIGKTTENMGGSHFNMINCGSDSKDNPPAAKVSESKIFNSAIPRVDLKQGPVNASAVAKLIKDGLVASAHDCSDGGLLVGAAEMAFSGRVGLDLDISALWASNKLTNLAACFAETPSRYLLEVEPGNVDLAIQKLNENNIPFSHVGRFKESQKLTVESSEQTLMDESLDGLRQTWQQTLDW